VAGEIEPTHGADARAYVHKTLLPILKPDDCLIFDGGDFCHFGRSYLPALRPKRWLNVSSLGMLGSSLPSALDK
jgi:thiamine pyrophosphate-dependent acetolactate synthase large subunit-like protein